MDDGHAVLVKNKHMLSPIINMRCKSRHQRSFFLSILLDLSENELYLDGFGILSGV